MMFRLICAPLILFACLLRADTPVERASFSELIKSDTAYANDGDVVSAEALLWQKYINEARADNARKAQHDAHELNYGDKTMRFSLEKRGQQGAHGYPVYIALHGGGGAPTWLNDSQWDHMKIYYRDSVDNGIYIATRGVSDTWDLHFRDESYPLYDRLIENLIAYEGADPNRIYLLGFSAGGDGVYQITPRMPDRFAAANMSAGHHNWVRFDNLLNTPFLIQVGENDTAYNRNRVAAENFIALNDLAANHGGYIHDIFIHGNFGHNGWYDNDASGALHNVISDPVAWLRRGQRAQTNKNTNAVHWLNNYQRQNLPHHVIWDLSTRSPRTQTWGAHYVNDASSLKANRDLFYWLALDGNEVSSGKIEAEINTAENAVYLKEVTGLSRFNILLHKDVFDFNRPVVVYFGGQKVAEVNPQAKLNVMAKTLLERGDASLMFHDEIAIDLNTMHSNMESDTFTYCSGGRCSMMSAEDWKRMRNFPLDLNYTCVRDNQYAMTFDDGPSQNMPAIMEILARHDVKATFFVVGSNLGTEDGKSLVRAAHEAGHQIANHSFSHRSLNALTVDDITHELVDTQNAIIAALGDTEKVRLDSSIVRPPFGDIDPRVQEIAKNLNFTTVRWNSDRNDWRLDPTDGTIALGRVQQHVDFIKAAASASTFRRSIIDLNHESSQATLSVLDEIIPVLKNNGYQLVTVSECLGL